MRSFTTFAAIAAAAAFTASAIAQEEARWALVVHGGAGVIERGAMNAETEAAYRAAMYRALETGAAILGQDGSALDAVEAIIREMEDDPLFNAGRGAVFTAEGRNELDASIMIGSTMEAGAVAGVTNVRHPISLARTVMENSPHVMLAGEGAERFASEQGLETVEPAFFFTERRWRAMERLLGERGDPLPARPEGAPAPEEVDHTALDRDSREHRFGTVGVVALDSQGEIAAGTSTGGTTGKRWGRVGDSPVIGAGTYATSRCGVSATGTGEYFIRLNVAARICHEYEAASGDAGEGEGRVAADRVIQDALTAMGGDGGVIVLTADGEMTWSFNTPGMYRARASSETEPFVAIYGDEE